MRMMYMANTKKIQTKKNKPRDADKKLSSTKKKKIKRSDLPFITCYTDGSYSPKTNSGGWCAYLECDGTSAVIFGAELKTTISRMEINAVLQALRSITTPSLFHIFSDSMYVVNSIGKRWIQNWAANGWRTRDGGHVANKDLWEQVLQLVNFHKVKIQWVKGHNGNPGNELCDNIAQAWRSRITE